MIGQPIALTDFDDETVTLVLRLLQEDGQGAAMALVGKGKQAEGFETDAQMAMRLFLVEEIQLTGTFVNDRKMTRSMQRAVQLDGDACATASDQERIATTDRELCLLLSQGQPGTNQAPAETISDPSGNDDYDHLLQKLAYIFIDGSDDDEELETPLIKIYDSGDENATVVEGDLPESSAWASSRRSRHRIKDRASRRQCNSCMETKHFTDLARAPCKHEYCRDCLQSLFRTAMADESFFPPRCCRKEIQPNEYNRLLLTTELIREFADKEVEYRTPNRTYCHNAACAAFIPPTQYANCVATCVACGLQTCTTCKHEAHNGDCPNDLELQRVIEVARENGWQRCQQCWSMVELNTGCNHMSCRCGFQFCYICGAQWKTCGCEHWDEHRLYERAVEIDARDEQEGQRFDHPEAQPAGLNGPAEPNERLQAIEQQPEPGLHPRAHIIRPAVITPDDTVGHRAVNTATGSLFDAFEQLKRVVLQRERIMALMQDLRVNHECDHLRWKNRGGPRRCEECHNVMPVFIYECRQCRILACRRCKLHRL